LDDGRNDEEEYVHWLIELAKVYFEMSLKEEQSQVEIQKKVDINPIKKLQNSYKLNNLGKDYLV
jgi:uncharacterized protein (UPF0128 family)